MQYLARREHTRNELHGKLTAKGWDTAQVIAVLDELAAQQIQSDGRFVEAYVYHRTQAGYGPRRIKAELIQRGIQNIPNHLVDEMSNEWLLALERIWQKKFANRSSAKNLQDRAKQMRFLLYRGFSPEQVHYFLRNL